MFFETFAWLTSSMLLLLERANAWALLFTRLIATFVFFLPKPFYFFWGRIYCKDVPWHVSTSKKNPQITCKAIFRSCLIKQNSNELSYTNSLLFFLYIVLCTLSSKHIMLYQFANYVAYHYVAFLYTRGICTWHINQNVGIFFHFSSWLSVGRLYI